MLEAGGGLLEASQSSDVQQGFDGCVQVGLSCASKAEDVVRVNAVTVLGFSPTDGEQSEGRSCSRVSREMRHGHTMGCISEDRHGSVSAPLVSLTPLPCDAGMARLPIPPGCPHYPSLTQPLASANCTLASIIHTQPEIRGKRSKCQSDFGYDSQFF